MSFQLTSALAAVSNLHFFDDHHHFITHSSSRTSSFVPAHTHGGYGMGGGVGGWVGGGDNDVRYNYWTHCVRR